ncbi:hypothetical protein JCM9279_003574 [Rhodotorula babjevae]
MGRTKPTESAAHRSRPVHKRARLVTTRFDPAAIASAPQQQRDQDRYNTRKAKPKAKPQPKPKPAARQSVKTQAGISRDSGGTTTSGQSATLRAKVLAAVVRLSREKKRGQRGVGHSSVNAYLAQHAPAPSPSAIITDFASLVLEAKHQLIRDGILRSGEGTGSTLAVAPGVSEDVKKLYSESEPDSSKDERACTAFLSSTIDKRRTSSSKPALKRSSSFSTHPEVVIPVRPSSPSSSRRSTSSAKKRRASTTSYDGHGTSELDTLTESDNLMTPTRSRKVKPTSTGRSGRQKKKVRIVTPSEEDDADGDSSTDAQGDSDAEQDADVESDDDEAAATSGSSAALTGKAAKGRPPGALGRLTKLQLIAMVEQLRGEVKGRDGELEEAREQLEALGDAGRIWEERARALGWKEEPVATVGDEAQVGEEGKAGLDEKQEQQEAGEEAAKSEAAGAAPAQEAKTDSEPLQGFDEAALEGVKVAIVDKELAKPPTSVTDKIQVEVSSSTAMSPVKLAAAHDYDASIDADLLNDDDAFDAELRRAGWGTPSVPTATATAAAGSSGSSSTEPSPPAPRPFAGALLPVLETTTPEPRRGASAPPAPATPPSAREQARLTMQNGALTTVMTVLVDSPASHTLDGNPSPGRTSLEPEKAAVVPRRSSLPTDAALRGSPASTPRKAPADIFARFGDERTSGTASRSPAASAAASQVEKGLVRGGSPGVALSAARVAELEKERDEAEQKAQELEGELQKARAESSALEEDVGGILSRHHEIVTELSKQKLQLENTIAALDLKLADLKALLTQQQHEREQQHEVLSTLESNRDEIASLVLRHGLHHAQQAGSPIAWPTSTTLPHAQLVPVLESLLSRLHGRGADVERLERERNACAGLVAGLLRSCHDAGSPMSTDSRALISSRVAERGGTNLEAALQLVVRIVEQLVAKLGSTQSALEQLSQQVNEQSTLVTSYSDAFVRLANTLATSLGSTQSLVTPAPQYRLAFVEYVQTLASLVTRRFEVAQGQVAEKEGELRSAESALEKVEAQLEVETSRVAELVAEKDKMSTHVGELEGVCKSFFTSLGKVGALSGASASSAAHVGEKSSQA